MQPRIKICCISNLDEALMAIGSGASAIGLVGRMPSGPGPIPDARFSLQAIESVRPFGVDVCSEVRTDGRLDKQKLLDFILKVSEN